MNTYETSATVEDQGRVLVAGVPFPPGTEVEVTIKPARNGEAANQAAATNRSARLLAALNAARNTEPIGPLHREDLYDRHLLH